jgi:hypothetical protein
MYVDVWMLFAIYSIAVLALAVSVYALWSLEEIRKYYEQASNKNKTINIRATPRTKRHRD